MTNLKRHIALNGDYLVRDFIELYRLYPKDFLFNFLENSPAILIKSERHLQRLLDNVLSANDAKTRPIVYTFKEQEGVMASIELLQPKNAPQSGVAQYVSPILSKPRTNPAIDFYFKLFKFYDTNYDLLLDSDSFKQDLAVEKIERVLTGLTVLLAKATSETFLLHLPQSHAKYFFMYDLLMSETDAVSADDRFYKSLVDVLSKIMDEVDAGLYNLAERDGLKPEEVDTLMSQLTFGCELARDIRRYYIKDLRLK